MRAGQRWAVVLCGILLAPTLAVAGEVRPNFEPVGSEAAMREQRAVLKSLQAELVLAGARRKWITRREHQRKSPSQRAVARSGRRGAGSKPVAGAPLRSVVALPTRTMTRAPDALGANVRINPAPAFWTQSEVALATIGPRMVAAWNDGTQPFVTGPMGFATSKDAGRTWRPGAPLPLGNGVISWYSDPVLVADSRRGEFWFAALALVSPPSANAIGILKGSFTDSGFVWHPMGFARATRDTLPDKPWIALDPSSGALMLSYTSFFRVGGRFTDQIEFQRSVDAGISWGPPLRVSHPEEQGLVQGSRPAVGPDGAVHVVWAAVDTSTGSRGLDHVRICTSRDGGASFTAPVTVARIVTNFANGGPGCNRPYGINFPAISVDHSDGPDRGRVYVAWSESADFFSAHLGSLRSVNEGAAAGPPAGFEVGDVLRGVRTPGDPADVFRFTARRGESALFMLDSLDRRAELILGAGCGEDLFQLAYSNPPLDRPRVAVVSFSRDGGYTLTVTGQTAQGSGYRVRTGWLSLGQTRGRDVRDVFVSHSRDGTRWSEPARISDSPPGTDDWLPELAVGPEGHVYAAWYDWGDSPATQCAAVCNTRLSRSIDGGNSWQRVGTLSDRGSEWSLATSNLVPNQGDYIALTVDDTGVSAGWADARGGTPDVYFARFDPARLPAGSVTLRSVSLGSPHPNPSRGDLRISYTATPDIPARIELWDIAGRRIQEQRIAAPASQAELRLVLPTGLAAGVYLLRLTQGAASATVRVALVP